MTNSLSIKAILSLAATQLKAQGFDAETAKLEAQLLLQHALNVNRVWLISHANDVLNGFEMANFNALVQRRLTGEPIAYILGYREFYGLKLKVSPDTLIPRPDTETLADAALAKISFLLLNPSPPTPLPQAGEGNLAANFSPSPACGRGVGERGDITILDLGTGSGAIALAIAKHAPHVQVTAVDFSEQALTIARQNAQDLTVLNCQFLQSDWFSALKFNGQNQQFDIIVSNPPYIEVGDTHLNQGDLRFEPIAALASGADGLDDIRTIITQAKNHLKSKGWLILEHGYKQAKSVADLLKQAGFSEVETIKDLGSNDRVTLGKISNLSF